MKKHLQNKIALITGASRGIGRAIARSLSAYHMKLGLLGRSENLLREAAKEVTAAGSEAFVLCADLTEQPALNKAIHEFKQKIGTPDYLINNAGIGVRRSWKNITLAQELEMIATNYIAPVILTRLILPDMLERDGGHIININSIAGMYAAPYQGAYCASKAALRAYALSLAYELEKTNVKITTIYPGPVDTDFLDRPDFEGFRNKKEMTSPETIAKAVLSAIDDPRETVFIGCYWKLLAVKIAGLHPQFFRRIIEKKNKPPAG